MGYVLVAALVFASQSVCVGDNYDVYLLAGQSNMDGRGLARELSAAQKKPMEQAIIFYRTSIFQVTKKIAHHENMVRYICAFGIFASTNT